MEAFSESFVNRLRRDSRPEQKELFGRLYARMFRICQRYVLRTDEAEDCVMKGFMKAFQQIARFEYRDEQSLFWWVRKIMVNEALMAARKKHNFMMTADESIPEVQVDAEVWARLDVEDLHTLVTKLPTGYRTIFLLHAVEGYGHQEIASMLSITESTSKSQLFKARAKLKQLIDQSNSGYGNVGG